MFLANVKKLISSMRSITVQLTLLYSLSTFILVTIVSLFLYWAMENILYNAGKQFLSDETRILQNIIETKPNNISALKQEVEDIPRALESSVYHYYIRILDNQGNIVAETPNIKLIIKNNTYFSSENRLISKKIQKWQSDDIHYLLMQSAVNSYGQLWIIQIALDITYQQKVTTSYRRNVLIAIIGGALLSILLGYLISKKGMRRLYELTETTNKITANALQQRIDPQYWPKELNELGTAYNRMLDRIENSMLRLTELSDDLAHELRTPLTNLIGEAEMVLSHASSAEEYKQVIESSLEELNRIYQIVENLLFLAHAENPQINLQKTELNANKEINVMCRFYQAIADEKNIQLSCEGEATLHANSIMFRRMIGNLLSNSLKYSSNNSLVSFKIKEINNETIQIALSDQGVGIAAEHLPNIFNRFYRVDAARAQGFGSTGLGLAIVKSIIDLHHGTIFIESKLGNGTSIIITFPK